ncbi:MAG: hypothetical protein H8D23_30245 [Candidatus Brocadiales bacterium]|nr:hypothetical protein [Candidatus Brocadiales bacterium]
MANQPDFSKITGTKKKQTSTIKKQIQDQEELKHLQVRLTKSDAKKFRRAAEDADLTLQSALIQAINRIMSEWGESEVADPGTARKQS